MIKVDIYILKNGKVYVDSKFTYDRGVGATGDTLEDAMHNLQKAMKELKEIPKDA